jgi:hypothetical protein
LDKDIQEEDDEEDENNYKEIKDKNGFKSIILACRYLRQINNDQKFKPHKPGKLKYGEYINSFQVYMKDDKQKDKPSFEIYYEPYKCSNGNYKFKEYSVNEQFVIKQEFFQLGVRKELNLYSKDTQEYFEDIFKNNDSTVKNILFVTDMANRDEKSKNIRGFKAFYEYERGVIFEEKKCNNCITKLFDEDHIDKGCKELFDEECYNKIRNKPDGLVEKIKEKLNRKKFEKDISKWECAVCLLENDNNVNKCIACDTQRS